MNAPTRDSAWNLSRCRVAAVLAFFALNLAVYLVRIVSVWRYGALFCSTAVESPMIDSIWRCMNHRPVYTWPFTFPFSLSLYNYSLYDVYAAVLRLMGTGGDGILTWGRQFTLLFGDCRSYCAVEAGAVSTQSAWPRQHSSRCRSLWSLALYFAHSNIGRSPSAQTWPPPRW